jgi:hypothetical protein
LITIKKQLGRQLKGKSIFLVTVGTDEALPQGFEIPFKSTAEYFNMSYESCIYFSTKFPEPEKFQDVITDFTQKLRKYYQYALGNNYCTLA